eukprot:4511631-Karenia_brevis.AAC.1
MSLPTLPVCVCCTRCLLLPVLSNNVQERFLPRLPPSRSRPSPPKQISTVKMHEFFLGFFPMRVTTPV